MATSAGSLVYGLPINAHDLIKAGKAYDKFVPNAFVLDLIIARKERGGVVKYEKRWKGRIGLADVPIEVLDMIRWELLNRFVRKERSYFAIAHDWMGDLFEQYAVEDGKIPCDCDACEDFGTYGEEERKAVKRKRKIWKDPSKWGEWEWDVHDDECDSCSEMIWGGQIWGENVAKGISRVRRVLRVYGLSLPSTTNLTQIIDHPLRADHLSLVVALPTYASKNSVISPISSFSSAASSHDLDDNYSPETCHSASYFSPNFFDISFADDAKFRRLVRDFSLRTETIESRSITRYTDGECKDAERNASLEEERERKWKEQVVRERERERERERQEVESEEEEEEQEEGGKKGEPESTDEDEEPIPRAPAAVRPEWVLLHGTYVEW
ncbi:hypothetical protein MNV49_007423 [Pseudohyphozyma bogoriensis]|nr:hypothetical protein MNV49_007423 [Pseudohyphozyma bogoriensis]